MATPNAAPAEQGATEEVVPIVIDLGKEKRGRIKDLKRGRGKLMDEVNTVIDEVRANLGPEAEGGRFIPVVVLYEKKAKRKGRGKGMRLPFMTF